MRLVCNFAWMAVLLAVLPFATDAVGETPVIGEANAAGDLSGLEPPTLMGREINPDEPWEGRMRRSWAGALEVYRNWEAEQAQSTAVPLPSAALAGLALLGGLGGARSLRRPRED